MSTIEKDGCKLVPCQLCRVMVASIAEHEGGARHQASRRLAAAALNRMRAHLAAQTNISNDVTDDPISTDFNTDMDQVFCGACFSNVPVLEKNHWRCKTHLMNALNEQVLDELVREYVEDEDLPLMEAPSKDPSVVETGKVVGNSEVAEKYKCYLCNVPIPTVFRSEHELSVRHRANLACANAASRRISAYLAPTASTFLPLETSTADKITPLLKVYVNVTKDEPEMFEKEKEKVTEIEAYATAKIRLTAKKYFSEVQKHLNEIGDFCAIIIDDTEYVTVKSGKHTLRVHVADFNGVYNVGDEMKCRICDYNNFYKSYNSERQHDQFHVMSLAHIARVLTPIHNVHGIRRIDNTHYFCIICNVCLPSGSAVKNHIMTDIQHTALLPEALERGNAFKESKDDLKIILYSQGTNDTQTVKPPNFYVSRPTFGAARYSPADEKPNHFAQPFHNNNTTFGSSPSQNIFGFKSHLNGVGHTCSEHPTENAKLPKGFGTTATAFGASQTGNLPEQNTPTLFAQSPNDSKTLLTKSNNTNATFGSSAQQTMSQPIQNTFGFKPDLNGAGQTCSEHLKEKTPVPTGFGTTSSTATAFGTSQTRNLPEQNTPTLFAQSSNNTHATLGSSTPRTINWPHLNGPGQTRSEHPTENAPLPKSFGKTATAFGTSQTGNLPDQNTPTIFAQSSNNTNATFGSSTQRTINWPHLNGPGQTCSEHPTENAPLPKGFGTTATAFGTSEIGNLPDQNTPTLFAQSSNNTHATLDSSTPRTINWPHLNGPGQTRSEHPTENAPLPKSFGKTATAFGTSQTGNLPDQNSSLFAQSSNNTNATLGSSTPRTINWPHLNGAGQTRSEHPTENAPLPKSFGKPATAFGTSQTGNLPDQNCSLFAQSSNNTNATLGSCTPRTINWPHLNGPGQTCPEHPTTNNNNATLTKGYGTTATAK